MNNKIQDCIDKKKEEQKRKPCKRKVNPSEQKITQMNYNIIKTLIYLLTLIAVEKVDTQLMIL